LFFTSWVGHVREYSGQGIHARNHRAMANSG